MKARRACVTAVGLVSFAFLSCSGGDTVPENSVSNAGPASRYSAAVSPKNDSGMQGHVMVSPGSDSLTIKLEVLGLKGGTEYPVHLHRGSCEQGGPVVTELNAPTVASVGLGSSLTALAPDVLQAEESYFVQLHQPDGTPAACADLERPGAQESDA